MRFLKHRPRLSLFVPPDVVVGQAFRARVVVDCRRAVEVRGIIAMLEGEELVWGGLSSEGRRRGRPLCRVQETLASRVQLSAGRHEYFFTARVPEDRPPTYRGQRCDSRYRVMVRVDIPWWRDRLGSFALQVEPGPPETAHPGPPALVTTDETGRAVPYLECSLDATVITPGDVLSGAIAVFNVRPGRCRGAVVSLVASEKTALRLDRPREVRRYDLELEVDDVDGGAQTRFRMRVPPTELAPTVRSRLWHLEWRLHARVALRWASDLELAIPVTMAAPRYKSAIVRERSAPPSVGPERVRRMWRRVAERHGVAFVDERMCTSVGDVVVEVQRDQRGRHGSYLVAELRYPDLGIELTVEPSRALLGGARNGVRVGGSAWSRRHRCSARDAVQANAFFGRVGSSLANFREVSADDRRCRLEVQASAGSQGQVEAFVLTVLGLADAWDAAIATIPAPSAAAGYVERWQELAARLDGTLRPGPMAVRGSFRGVSVEVRTRWLGEKPVETVIGLSELPPTERQFSASDPDDLGQVPEELRGPVATLLEQAMWIRVEREAISVAVDAPLTDPSGALAILPRLADFADATRTARGGPFR